MERLLPFLIAGAFIVIADSCYRYRNIEWKLDYRSNSS